MKYVRLNDISMALEDEGVGIPLLLIPGYPPNRHLWRPQVEGLSSFTRVIAPDMRGHGATTSLKSSGDKYSPYLMEMLADECAQLLDALEIDQPVILCGLSMGGYISFSFYRKYPLGTEPGAGFGLLIVFCGIGGTLISLSGCLIPAVRNVDDALPDHDALNKINPEATASQEI